MLNGFEKRIGDYFTSRGKEGIDLKLGGVYAFRKLLQHYFDGETVHKIMVKSGLEEMDGCLGDFDLEINNQVENVQSQS